MNPARGRRSSTLIELILATGLLAIATSIAFGWLAVTLHCTDVAARGATAAVARDRLVARLIEDLTRTRRLVPDISGTAFLLEMPADPLTPGAEPELVLYECVRERGTAVLTRTTRAQGGSWSPTGRLRLARGIEGCRGEVEGRAWRVHLKWSPGVSDVAGETEVLVARRVEVER